MRKKLLFNKKVHCNFFRKLITKYGGVLLVLVSFSELLFQIGAPLFVQRQEYQRKYCTK